MNLQFYYSTNSKLVAQSKLDELAQLVKAKDIVNRECAYVPVFTKSPKVMQWMAETARYGQRLFSIDIMQRMMVKKSVGILTTIAWEKGSECIRYQVVANV